MSVFFLFKSTLFIDNNEQKHFSSSLQTGKCTIKPYSINFELKNNNSVRPNIILCTLEI